MTSPTSLDHIEHSVSTDTGQRGGEPRAVLATLSSTGQRAATDTSGGNPTPRAERDPTLKPATMLSSGSTARESQQGARNSTDAPADPASTARQQSPGASASGGLPSLPAKSSNYTPELGSAIGAGPAAAPAPHMAQPAPPAPPAPPSPSAPKPAENSGKPIASPEDGEEDAAEAKVRVAISECKGPTSGGRGCGGSGGRNKRKELYTPKASATGSSSECSTGEFLLWSNFPKVSAPGGTGLKLNFGGAPPETPGSAKRPTPGSAKRPTRDEGAMKKWMKVAMERLSGKTMDELADVCLDKDQLTKEDWYPRFAALMAPTATQTRIAFSCKGTTALKQP